MTSFDSSLGAAFFAATWHILLSLAPWLLIGTVIAGLLHVLLPKNLIRSQLSGPGGVIKAVLFGVPMPLCSCGVIPAGLSLKRDGASDGAALGFLISTPQTGVDSILVSSSFLGWPFALFKLGSAAVTGLAGGWIADALGDGGSQEAAIEDDTAGTSSLSRMRELWEHGIDLLRSIWRWLVFGIAVSAGLEVMLPDQALAGFAAYGGLVAALLALGVSLPLYVCATASVPIAATLVANGMPTGAALVFLMAGPATNVATVGAVYRAFGARNLAVYLSTVIVGSVGLGLLFDSVIDPGTALATSEHHMEAWWAVVSAIALIGLLAWFAGEDLRRLWRARKGPPTSAEELQELAVEGMSCMKCVRKLEGAITAEEGVSSATVTLEPGKAMVQGAISAARLREVVQEAGFQAV